MRFYLANKVLKNKFPLTIQAQTVYTCLEHLTTVNFSSMISNFMVERDQRSSTAVFGSIIFKNTALAKASNLLGVDTVQDPILLLQQKFLVFYKEYYTDANN